MRVGTSSATANAAFRLIAQPARRFPPSSPSAGAGILDHILDPDRFRKYLPAEKRYVGWMGRKMTRAEYSRASGICIPTLKQIETKGVKPRAVTLKKIEALQKLIGASEQSELLPPNRAAEKLAARRERERDKWLDSMLAKARKPMKKSAKQASIF
jgi:transcriptional regulator with XRE-family HTH domain